MIFNLKDTCTVWPKAIYTVLLYWIKRFMCNSRFAHTIFHYFTVIHLFLWNDNAENQTSEFYRWNEYQRFKNRETYLTSNYPHHDMFKWKWNLTLISDVHIWHSRSTFIFDIYIWHLYTKQPRTQWSASIDHM